MSQDAESRRSQEQERLYESMPDEVECVESYRPGGYHPVVLGDVFHDGRFKVIHKLGHGTFSTVWLARDRRERRLVALKVLRADAGLGDREASVMEHLAKVAAGRPGYSSLMRPLLSFGVHGINGSHKCLVMPLAGPSLNSFIVSHGRTEEHVSPRLVKTIMYNATRGLVALTKAGVTHGDLSSNNIFLQITGFESWSDDEVSSRFGEPSWYEVSRCDSTERPRHAPPYLVEPLDFSRIDASLVADTVLLGDFGESFLDTDLPSRIAATAPFKAPELLFDPAPRTRHAIDIWALACDIYFARTRGLLFSSVFNEKDDLLHDMVACLGRLPQPWWDAWERRPASYDEDGSAVHPSGSPAGKYGIRYCLRQYGVKDSSGRTLPEARQHRMPGTEVEHLAQLLERMLVYEPEMRINAADILESAWFDEVREPTMMVAAAAAA